MKRIALLLLALLPAVPAQAVDCPGVVKQILMEPGGDLNADWGYGWVRFCFVDQTITVYRGANSTNGTIVTPKRCDVLYTSFATAMASGRPINVTVERSDCAMMSTTQSGVPNPYPTYFIFKNQ